MIHKITFISHRILVLVCCVLCLIIWMARLEGSLLVPNFDFNNSMGCLHVLHVVLGSSSYGIWFIYAHSIIFCTSFISNVFLIILIFLMSPSEWRAYGSYARPIYILATSGLTIFTILWSVFSAVEQVSFCFFSVGIT